MKNKTELLSLTASFMLLNPLFSSAQNVRLPSSQQKKIHSETMDDAYLPNAFNNQKTTPAYKYSNAATKLSANGSSIFTIQVNVDGSGQNIWGDAANEPNIALNPLNENYIVIGWRQFDNVSSNFRQAGWSYTTDAGASWTFPGKIEAGVFRSDPVLDYDASGNFYYNSLTNTFDCKVFKSTDGGASWNTGVNAWGGDKQWMTIDRTTGVGSGNIYSIWTSTYSTCLPGYFTRSSDGGNSFESCTDASDSSFWNSMAVGNNGELYIAGADTNGNMQFMKSLNAEIPSSVINWNAPVTLNTNYFFNGWLQINPSGLLGQANIDVDRSSGPGKDNIYVAASMTPSSGADPGDVMFSRSTDGGLTWSSMTRINDDASTSNTQWMGTMSVAPNGRIDIIWLDTRDDLSGLDSSALYYSYSIDEGNTWSANEKLSGLFDPHVGYPNQNKMGDYFDMISDNAGAHLSWTNTLNGEEDVYYSHIIPPIANGVNEFTIQNSEFRIYPNPTSGIFTVAVGSDSSSQYKIEIYNVYGEKVFSRDNGQLTMHNGQLSIINSSLSIDLSSQPSGIYFLQLKTEQGTATKKIVINK